VATLLADKRFRN